MTSQAGRRVKLLLFSGCPWVRLHPHAGVDTPSKTPEIQADFAFLSQHGEVSHEESSNAVKILVLTQTVSNAIGYVVVGDNRARILVTQWLKLFGMESEKHSIILHADVEQAIRNLITGSSSQISFQVRKARNQQHQSVGFLREAFDVS